MNAKRIRKLRERRDALRDELRDLASRDEPSEDDLARFDEIRVELEGDPDDESAPVGILRQLEIEEARARAVASLEDVDDIDDHVDRGIDLPGGRDTTRTGRSTKDLTRDDTHPAWDLTRHNLISGADTVHRTALEIVERHADLTDRNRESAEMLLRRADTRTRALARHIIATGRPAYRSAFAKMIGGEQMMLTPDEQKALQNARALSLTDAEGGYAVPFTLDPTIIDTKDMATSPMRRLSTVKTTVTDQWQGVTSAGMTVSWDGEAAEVSDDSPGFGQAPIPVHKAQGFALGSIEIVGDYAGLEADLSGAIRNGKSDDESQVLVTGTGTDQPTGIVTALAGTASEISPLTAEAFAVGDLYNLEELLPPKYRLSTLDGELSAARASWIAARGTYNVTRDFGATTDGGDLWVRLGAGLPPELIGYRAYEASVMDSARDIDDTATADNRILVLGDFRYFYIVDRVGLAVEYIPHIFGANGRPTGERGWYCYWRQGADSVNDDAFRMLNVATTA